jgi:vancomycin permeability regulator SanA
MNMLSGIGKLFAGVAAGAILIVGVPNAVVCSTSAPCIVGVEEARALHPDCILVLGAAVHADGTLSHMLNDRLDVAAGLYFAGVAPKVIVSGNGEASSNNEPAAMKAYLVGLGVSSEDVYCDGYGFNTYDSMWRARNAFGVNRVIVVTQTYHEYRALFNARGTGMEALGVPSDLRGYAHQIFYDFREVFARVKDTGQVLLHIRPDVPGEAASLDQSGDVTE